MELDFLIFLVSKSANHGYKKFWYNLLFLGALNTIEIIISHDFFSIALQIDVTV